MWFRLVVVRQVVVAAVCALPPRIKEHGPAAQASLVITINAADIHLPFI